MSLPKPVRYHVVISYGVNGVLRNKEYTFSSDYNQGEKIIERAIKRYSESLEKVIVYPSCASTGKDFKTTTWNWEHAA